MKRKYDSIMNWGEAGEVEDDLDAGMKSWLMVEDRGTICEGTDRVQDVIEIPEQMEIGFVKRVAETWPRLSPEMVPDGRKVVKTRR